MREFAGQGGGLWCHKYFHASACWEFLLKSRPKSRECRVCRLRAKGKVRGIKYLMHCSTIRCKYIEKWKANGKSWKVEALKECLECPFSRLDFSRNYTHCNASLLVNDTLAMSGDQPTWLKLLPPRLHTPEAILNTWLHLGGAPQAPIGLIIELPPAQSGSGFTGCLHTLRINGQAREIFGWVHIIHTNSLPNMHLN